MSKVWDRSLSNQKNVELEIDLVELFDGQFVPNSSSLRQAVGQAVIDVIRKRTTDDQQSWTGKSFKDYSPEYADTIEFKAYGKSQKQPNLTQSGDMLGLMTVKETRDPGKIKIGWDDDLQSEKAHGHITGAVGVKRDFFGLTSGEVSEIKNRFKDQVEASPESPNTAEKFKNFLEGRSSIGEKSLNDVLAQFYGDEG